MEDVDKQNLEVELQWKVENDIRIHGNEATAHFIKLLWLWFMASDGRGITLEDRLNWFIDIHEYMMQFHNPGQFPPPSTHIYLFCCVR